MVKMALEMERSREYTRLKYCGFGRDIEWYIKEPFVPGVRQCIQGELILNLPMGPNLVKMFPNGGFLERDDDKFKVIENKDTIDAIIRAFQR